MAKVSISQAWDETRAVLARDGKLISSVALALIVLPGLLINVLVPNPATLGNGIGIGWGIIGLAGLLLTVIGQISVLRLALGPHISVADAIRHGAVRALPFLGAFLLWVAPFLALGSIPYGIVRAHPAQPSSAAVLALFAVLAIAVFLAVRLLLIGPVAAAESGGSLRIIRRSWDLTEGNWWRLFGFVLVFVVAAMILLSATTAALGLVARVTSGPASQLSIAGLVIALVLQLLTAAIYVVLFVMQARIYAQLTSEQTDNGKFVH